MKEYKLLNLYLVAFVAILMLSNIIAGKLIQIGPIILTAAVFLFPLSYIFGDVLTEVYGYARSRRIIWYGFGANILMSLIFLMAIVLPYPPFWKGQEAFKTVLGLVPRLVLASLVGYWVGSFGNSWILARMKEWMLKWDPQSKHLWMRTIASTIVGEGIDTILFGFIAFIGSMPFVAVLTMIGWQWVMKVGVEVAFTPVTYLVIHATKKAEGMDVVGTETYSPFRWLVRDRKET